MQPMHPLQNYRAEHHLSQRELAVKLKVARNTVARWERRKLYPSPKQLPKLTELTGLPAAAFVNLGGVAQ